MSTLDPTLRMSICTSPSHCSSVLELRLLLSLPEDPRDRPAPPREFKELSFPEAGWGGAALPPVASAGAAALVEAALDEL